MSHPAPPRTRQANVYTWITLIAVAAATALIAPWSMVDADALSRLAIGRTIVTTGQVPATDPFTFTDPQRPWSNPEWLGDTLLYLVHHHLGRAGAQLYKLTLIAGGMVLTLLLATRAGATPLLAAGLLILLLPACVVRFTLRNEIHALWLVPAYGLLLQAAIRDRRWLWGIVPLGVLWANLHASFPLGWVVLLSHWVQWLYRRGQPGDVRPPLNTLLLLLLVHPALALVAPHPVDSYRQVLDHLTGAPIYRQLILEWQTTQTAPRMVALVLHLTALLGLVSFLPPRHREPGPFLLLLAGLALGYASRRFMPLLVVLALPPVAVNATMALDSLAPRSERFGDALLGSGTGPPGVRRWLRLLPGLIFTLSLIVITPVVWAARTDTRPQVMDRPDAPVAAARFLVQACRGGDCPGSRLFNPYNGGPWLLWIAGPRIQLYIDPRNNLGAELLQHYVQQVLPDPLRFDREVERLHIDLCLVDLSDRRYERLAYHLMRGQSRWQMLYLDGHFALYSRNRTRHAYHVLRGVLDFDHLSGVSNAQLRPDLDRLARQAPALARALHGHRLLARDEPARARALLEQSLPQLPPSAALMADLALAMARTGDCPAARQVLGQARQLFGRDPHLRRGEGEINRRCGR